MTTTFKLEQKETHLLCFLFETRIVIIRGVIITEELANNNNNDNNNIIYLTTLSSKSTSARSKYERALNLHV